MRNYQLSRMIAEQTRKYGTREVLRYKDVSGKWISVSWIDFEQQIRQASLALAAVGVGEQENIATYTPNRPEGLVVDFAAYANRAVVVPLYPTGSLEQLEYIVRDAEIRYLFVGEQYQYDNAWKAMSTCPTLKQIIIFDTAVQRAADDTCSIYFGDFMAMGAPAAAVTALLDERAARAVGRRPGVHHLHLGNDRRVKRGDAYPP